MVDPAQIEMGDANAHNGGELRIADDPANVSTLDNPAIEMFD